MVSRGVLRVVISGIAVFGVACGNSKLTSVNVSPAIADAQNFPNGMVQFSASGTYSSSSKVVPLANLTWCIGTSSGTCNGNIASVATVDNHGLAQCLPGAKAGVATILAGSGGHVGNPDGGSTLAVFGSAQLTCP